MGSWHGHSDSEIMGQGGNPTATQISSQYQQAPFKTIGKALGLAGGPVAAGKKAIKAIKGSGASNTNTAMPTSTAGNINPEAEAAEFAGV